MPAQFLIRVIRAIRCLERSVAHATRCANRRQKCRERGYYYLHRYLNHSLLHTPRIFFEHESHKSHEYISARSKIRVIRAIRG